MSELFIKKSAIISECGLYLYELRRTWDEQKPQMVFIMLNPSTADAEKDDQTIRRCIGFAQHHDFGGIVVCNLGAGRATSPKDWMKMEDPIGTQNDWRVGVILRDEVFNKRGKVIAAWGAWGGFMNRDVNLKNMAKAHGVRLWHLGTTKDGMPKHPLARGKEFIPYEQELRVL
jgi:hypothetical protein